MKMMKKVCALVIGAALSVTLAACGGGEKTNTAITYDEDGNIVFENVELTLWNPISGADGTKFTTIVNKFNAQYKGKIHVTSRTLGSEMMYQSLALSQNDADAPDMALVHNYRMPELAASGILIDMDTVKARNTQDPIAIDNSQFASSAIAGMNYGGKQYGYPLDIHSVAMFANTELITKYCTGKTYSDTGELMVAADGTVNYPKNKDQMFEMCRCAPNDTTVDVTDTWWGLALSYEVDDLVKATALIQNGGKEVDENDYPAWNTEEGQKAAKSISEYIFPTDGGKAISPQKTQGATCTNLFRSGKSMFLIEGTWGLVDNDKALNVGDKDILEMAPLSYLFAEDTSKDYADKVVSRSHMFVMTKNIGDLESQAALEFIMYFSQNSLSWSEGGHMPANNEVRNSDAYKASINYGLGDIDIYQLTANSPYYKDAMQGFNDEIALFLENPIGASNDIAALLQKGYTESKGLVDEAKANA